MSRDVADFPPTARGFLEMEAFALARMAVPREQVIGSGAEFFLKYGEEFDGGPRPDWVPQMAQNMCFSNCFDLTAMHNDLTYCEGFVHQSGLPINIHHAWCLDATGVVIEPTLIDRPYETRTYFGIRFTDFAAVAAVVDETRSYSVLFKDAGHALVERLYPGRA